ncbi:MULTISPECIES: hypothetical protein [Polaromonas]|uniref:Lipoprotein n=1 Tax=Polaromonas aquatica TaxID=332657 RepID=A0ABW1TQN9_9BURK
MKSLRLSGLLALAGLSALLSGCVVAPIEPGPYAAYPARPVYVNPGPVVVVPAPYYGYRGWGYRRWH